PCLTTVSTLSTAKLGSALVADRPTPPTLVMVGMPSAAEPCKRPNARLEVTKARSVLTTSSDTKPCPKPVATGTSTARSVGVQVAGTNGPWVTGPPAVATKKLTTEPAVKFKP